MFAFLSRRRRFAPARLGCMSATAALLLASHAAAQPASATPNQGVLPATHMQSCWLHGVPYAAMCGHIQRPLNPAQPQGKQIEVHFAVLSAVARNKASDPVFVFAGGPGQSAMALAGPLRQMLREVLNRRDVVLVDQRGTGKSAPLECADESADTPLSESADPAYLTRRMTACRDALQKLPYGDLRQFTTTIAMADVEAVRQALRYGPINAVGASYGTRAVLEYMRLYPASVRRAVIDGVAPPDMALPMSFSADAQAALDALLRDCERDTAGCQRRYPTLRADWHALLASLPRAVQATESLSGRTEPLTLTRDLLTSVVRMQLYSPVTTSALPYAITQAARGNTQPLLGLAGVAGGNRALKLAMGMHHSVICAEDMPRLAHTPDVSAPDFGDTVLRQYREVCALWPKAAVAPAFYTVPRTQVPTLLLSGGMDPVTPPRHAERVAQALGAQARHVVVPGAGHGVLAGVRCVRDAALRFITKADTALALAQADEAAQCSKAIPRPPAFKPVAPRSHGAVQPQEGQR